MRSRSGSACRARSGAGGGCTPWSTPPTSTQLLARRGAPAQLVHGEVAARREALAGLRRRRARFALGRPAPDQPPACRTSSSTTWTASHPNARRRKQGRQRADRPALRTASGQRRRSRSAHLNCLPTRIKTSPRRRPSVQALQQRWTCGDGDLCVSSASAHSSPSGEYRHGHGDGRNAANGCMSTRLSPMGWWLRRRPSRS